jgi:hypothetical protein
VKDGKMFVIGGSSVFDYSNDVWYSSNGVEWYKATEHSAFPALLGQTSVISDGKIWVIGGCGSKQSASLIGTGCTNSIWYTETQTGSPYNPLPVTTALVAAGAGTLHPRTTYAPLHITTVIAAAGAGVLLFGRFRKKQ